MFASRIGDVWNLFWARSDGAEEPQKLFDSRRYIVPWAITPDGKRLAYFELAPDTLNDIWTVPLDTSDAAHPKAGKPEIFLRTPANEVVPTFSPDGRWVAYRSNESGIDEIYVRPFPPGLGGKWPISTGGGVYGEWSNNGHELFYETADSRIMVVDYTMNGNAFVPSKPRLWTERQIFFPGPAQSGAASGRQTVRGLSHAGRFGREGSSAGNLCAQLLRRIAAARTSGRKMSPQTIAHYRITAKTQLRAVKIWQVRESPD